MLTKLNITNLRNIEAAQLKLNPQNNIITGLNGSGKTTVCEAIHMLGCGISFRSHKQQPLVRFGAENCAVSAQGERDQGLFQLGVARADQQTQYKVDAQKVSRAKLAACLPVVCFHPESFLLLTEAKERRSFFNWLMFHVEHSFLDASQRYDRALAQRNHLIKTQALTKDVRLWDTELIEQGELLHEIRQRQFALFQELWPAETINNIKVDIQYKPGFAGELSEALEASIEQDRRLGYTSVGPHRADFAFKVQGRPLLDVASRGQLKSVVARLLLTKAQRIAAFEGKKGVFIADDIASELDPASLHQFIEQLHALAWQTVYTGVSSQPLEPFISNPKMFHVKHGVVKETRPEHNVSRETLPQS